MPLTHPSDHISQIQAALERVRQGADVMPRSQLEGVLSEELGSDWRSLMAEFDYEPKAAASIGQVGAKRTLHAVPVQSIPMQVQSNTSRVLGVTEHVAARWVG